MFLMGVEYLDYAGVSAHIQATTGAVIKPHVLRKYQAEARRREREGASKDWDMPAPDERFSGAPAWKASTIDRWMRRRPGRGKGSAEGRERARAEREGS